jgi:hypothetical protein
MKNQVLAGMAAVMIVATANAQTSTNKLKITINAACKVVDPFAIADGREDDPAPLKFENGAWRGTWPGDGLLPEEPKISVHLGGMRTFCRRSHSRPDDEAPVGKVNFVNLYCSTDPTMDISVNAEHTFSYTYQRRMGKQPYGDPDLDQDLFEASKPHDDCRDIIDFLPKLEHVNLQFFSVDPNAPGLRLDQLEAVQKKVTDPRPWTRYDIQTELCRQRGISPTSRFSGNGCELLDRKKWRDVKLTVAVKQRCATAH